MRFRETFRYELGYRLRSASTWLYGALLLLLAFWVVHVDNTGSHTIAGNAPFRVAEVMALFCGLFGMVVTAGLFSDAALRDRTSRMDPLLFTTRLRPAEFLGGRFLATLLVNAVLVLATPLGIWVGTLMPYLDREGFVANHAAVYLQPLLLFTLPNLFLTGAILFAIAVLTRQTIPVYLGVIAIFIGYIVAANYWSGIANPILSALADPLGINALKEMTKYWTASERNTRMIGFPAMLLWNRLLWVGLAAGIFVLLQRSFRFSERVGRGRAEGGEELSAITLATQTGVSAPQENHTEAHDAESGVESAPQQNCTGAHDAESGVESAPQENRTGAHDTESGVERTLLSAWKASSQTGVSAPQAFGPRTRVLQTLAVMRDALADILSGWAFRVAFVAAIGLVLLWGWNVGATIYDTVTWPVTHLVAGVVLAQRSIVIPWLVIVIFAGELVWKDRETGAAEIAGATPARTGVVLLGRFLALVVLIALFQLAFLIGGMLLQALHGYYNFEPGLYLQILFGIKLVDYVLLAALAMTIHVLVNQKYVGHVLVLLAIVMSQGATYGFHDLVIYNSGPDWTYSEMNGFGPFVGPFLALKLYWAAWALLLGVLALLFWPRGPEPGFRKRLSAALARLRGPAARLAIVAAMLIAAFGGFVFYNTNVLNEHLPPQNAGAPQAEYERRYGRYRDLPQPVITAASLRFELYPEDTAAEMSGSYQLVNRTGATIRTVHIETPRAVGGYEVRSMSFDRAAKAELVDAEYGYRIFALDRPLAPGESLRFQFNVAFHPRGFPHGGAQTTIVRNGTYIDRRLLPFIGYQPFVEVADEKERKKYGLPPRKALREPGDALASSTWSLQRDGDRIRVETIVGTSEDQIAVVPGMLRRSWTENGRRYFHYASREPETFGTAVFSAKYAVRNGRWKDVALQVFHHPPHRANLDRMVAGMQSALDYYTSQFGPYPYRELRIVEIPPYSVNARAFPSALALAEQNFITRNDRGTVDLTFFGTAHEVAHQWWGGQVRPAHAKGRRFVSESLANYSAMMVTEKVLGPAEARRVYDYQMNRYLTQRGEFGRDVPLLEVDDHPYVSYGKGAVALYTLREHIGGEAVNAALKRFLEKYRRSGPPYATSLDLYAELRAATPLELRPLLTDLFETITVWDLETKTATSRRLRDGRYEVTLNVLAQKLRADGVGRETATPMNDLVEVGVFASGKDAPIYQARHRIHTGQQTLKIIVPAEPARAGVDPQHKLIERERGDNVVDVEKTR